MNPPPPTKEGSPLPAPLRAVRWKPGTEVSEVEARRQPAEKREGPPLAVHSVMATSGARILLWLPRASAFPRLRSAEGAWQGGRRSVSGVAIARQSRRQVLASRVPSASSQQGPSRRLGVRGVGGLDGGVLLPRQTARGLTSGVVSAGAGAAVYIYHCMVVLSCADVSRDNFDTIRPVHTDTPVYMRSLLDYCCGSSVSACRVFARVAACQRVVF